MKKLFLVAIVLGAFLPTGASGDSTTCWCYGGEDGYTYWYLYDCDGHVLEEGDYVYVAWAGPDGEIDPPAGSKVSAKWIGDVTDDDSLFKEAAIHDLGGFNIKITVYDSVHPMQGDLIYCRVFDDPKNELTLANYYGDSDLYELKHVPGEEFFCVFRDNYSYYYSYYPPSPYCDCWCTTCWPIPTLPFVALMSFGALGRDCQVLLEWKTASETDNFGFYIERSPDAETFHRITHEIIPGAGDSEVENTYAYVDRELTNGITYYYNLISVDIDGLEEVLNPAPVAATPTAQVPNAYSLSQNYPNPFNPVTEITYAIPRDAHVTLKVYNVLGHEVAALVDADREASFYTVRWDAEGLASGVYFCALTADDFRAVKKMVLLK